MNSAFEQLVWRFAYGRRVCACERAYLDTDCTRSSCLDGHCERRFMDAVHHISESMLKILDDDLNSGVHGAD